jgi:biopolymer transport protein ExbD
MDINTTPLIDVMLVLLVMLIITIPIQLHSVNLNMPVGTPPHSDAKPEVVKIDIDDTSTLYWNGTPVGDHKALQARLQAVAAQPEQPEVHIRPNKLAKYDRFAEVMVAVNQAGLHKLGVIGSEQFIDGK